MRHLKILGLALVAALAAMAFVGASSASAQIHECLWTPPPENVSNHAACLAAGGMLLSLLIEAEEYKAKATSPILKGALNQVCNASNTTFENKADETLGFEITQLSFTGECKPCSTVTTFAPYAGELTWEGEGKEMQYFLKWGGSLKLSGCPFGVSCKFGSSNVTLKFVLPEGMTNNEFRGEEEKLTLEEGSKLLCGSTGNLTANYVVESPKTFSWFLE